ncbi:calcofluor white hypersensitive protein [Cryptococcus wingfieldii CBS 7118]|uniref:Calcofluor white hypersensitive protein n=1 Tax=Cryptococcus wingfieldii CBS 7118 TaxID=1295528 RepID=A0A1E3IKT4_9TREE|nr:calcofluor white hypersensitive protein [Cryptococcus wingfieldii CBS 7118]ODN89207.1 calcofluor white hypersensitive protein [Cryptococcus wingfieldii CBS 7118]
MTVLLEFPAKWVTHAHTFTAALAFATALFLGWAAGLWKKLCANSVARWPVEWFPSVSATIGDHVPTRAPFQILIALCATPRFLLLIVQWLVHRNPSLKSRPSGARRPNTALADVEFIVGIVRTICCGGWVYVTSRDQPDVHDFFMILYLLLTVPWMYLSASNCSSAATASRRRLPMYGYLCTIPPLMWMYYRHSSLKIKGAYTYYSILEWTLVFWDLAFDSLSTLELGHLQIAFVDSSSPSTDNLSSCQRTTTFTFAKQPSELKPSADEPLVDWTNHGNGRPSSSLRLGLAWISDVYFGICFWTVFTGLSFQLFYWSVWKLALAGSELALMGNLAGYLFHSKSAFRYLVSRDAQITHRSITIFFGMGCYFLPWPFARLVCLVVGTWAGWSALLGTWVRVQGSEEILAEGQTLGLGIAITMLLKYVNYSNNPFWSLLNGSSGGWNKTGLVLGAISLAEYIYRPLDLHPAPPLPEAPGKDKGQARSAPPTALQTRFMSLGLGTAIHLIQTFLMDAGTVISWTWTGYPIKGPTLHPQAGFIIAATALGLASIPNALHPAWSTIGCLGALALYAFPDWTGFYGGVVLTYYLSSILPPYVRAASACSPATTFGNALLAYIVFDVVSVVTAAYAFVPMGWLLRERTDVVLGACMLSTAAGAWAGYSLDLPSGSSLPRRTHRRTKAVQRFTLISAGLFSLLSILYSFSRIPVQAPAPYYPEHRIFSAGIWTVHFGVDKDGRDSQRRMRDLVQGMEVDVLGLLETDLHRFVYGNRDLTRVMAEELGYYVDLGPGPNKHTWGAVLLSKFPILNSTHHLLPSPDGELAPAIYATLDIHGEHVNVMVSHNGQEEDLRDRTLQTTELARLLRETADKPTVFIGYLVTRTGDRRPWPYQILMEDGRMWDIEIDDRWRWCEYMAFRNMWRVAYARVHESDISDTELQVGKFMLGKPGQKVIYEDNQQLYWHVGEGDIPEPWRLPSQFRGNGVRGHRYVVWDGPLYYLPPKHSELRGYGWDWSTALDKTATIERIGGVIIDP